MKLMEGECLYTPARPSGQLPTHNRRMPQGFISTGFSSGTRLAAQILDPHRLSKARRKLFVGDSEPSSELSDPFGKTVTAAAFTEQSEVCQRLEACQDKWNFDLVNFEPLEGRYEWEKMEPEDVPRFYSKPYTNPKRRVTNIRESYSPNMVANRSYSRIRFREDGQSNESTTSLPPSMDITVLAKLNSDNNRNNNIIATNNTKGCDPNDIYNVPTASISTSTTCELEITNDKQQNVITDVCNDNLTHGSTYYCCSNRSSSSSSSNNNNNNNNNNMGSSSISPTTSRDGLLQRGMSPLMCFTAPVKNVVNTSNLYGSHEQDCNNDDNINNNNNNNNNNNVFSEKSDTCDTLTNILGEQLDNKQSSNLTAIDNNKATVSLPSLSSSSSSSPSYSSSAPSSPSSLSPPSSSPLSSYSSSTLPVSSSSSTTTKSYSMETLNETKTLPKQTKIVDYMPHRKRTLSYCHTGNREKKLRKE